MKTIPGKLGKVILLLGLGFSIQVQAQDFSELYVLYQNKNFTELQQKIEQIKEPYQDNIEVKFFKALFLENGDEAVKIYEQLYPATSGILRAKVGEKLAQYYYARGFYSRAAEIVKDQATTSASESAATRSGSVSGKGNQQSEKKKVNFVIQVGAFGQEDNARQLQKTLRAQNISSRLVTRMVNGRNLFCIWIEGTDSLDETLQIANNIKNRFKLEYRILEN
jgi:hypothetical protein